MNIRRREPVAEPRPVRSYSVSGAVWIHVESGAGKLTAAQARLAADELHDCAREAERRRVAPGKRLVLIEAPHRGDVERNTAYVRACMRDCFVRGEAPFASAPLYAQEGVLDDADPEERRMGIDAGLAWGQNADATVVYDDLGISAGMQQGIDAAIAAGRPVEYRSLPEWRERAVGHG